LKQQCIDHNRRVEKQEKDNSNYHPRGVLVWEGLKRRISMFFVQ
jgi:hypothetical protein